MTSRLGPKNDFWRLTLFLGLHHIKLNNNNQIQIPPNWLDFCKDGIYITQGFENNLIIHSKYSFQRIYDKIIQLNIMDPLVRLFSRMFLGSAVFFSLEDKPLIQLSPKQLTIAGVKKEEIILIGQGNYIEIWSLENWNIQEARMLYSLNDPNIFTKLSINLIQERNQ